MKYFIILFYLIINSSNLLPQEQVSPIKLNFNFFYKTFDDLDLLDQIEDGNFYQIVISNINSNLYSISINTSDTVLESQLNFPTFESLNFNQLKSILSGPQPESAISENIFLKESRKAQKKIDNTINRIIGINKEVENIKFEVKKIILSTKLEFKTYNVDYNYIQKMDIISKLRLEIDNELQDLTSAGNSYNKFLEDHKQELEDSGPKIKEVVKTTLENFSTVLKSVSTLAESVNAKNSYDMLYSIVAAENNKDFTYTSMPFRMFGNRATLEIIITPRDSNKLNLQTYKTKIEFPDKRISKFSIGSSYYFTAYYDEIKNYSIINTTSETVSYKISEQSSSTEMGFLASFNFFPLNNNFVVSISPGISITQVIRPRLGIGFGGAIGKRNLFVINGGLMLGLNEKLASGYNTDSVYYAVPGNISSLYLTGSVFISLGYTFSL